MDLQQLKRPHPAVAPAPAADDEGGACEWCDVHCNKYTAMQTGGTDGERRSSDEISSATWVVHVFEDIVLFFETNSPAFYLTI